MALILGAGIVLSDAVARRTEEGLRLEGIPRARLIGRVARGVLLAVVGALALWQLDFAREIVLAAFLMGFGAMGVAFALAVGIGSARAIEHFWRNALAAEAVPPGDQAKPAE